MDALPTHAKPRFRMDFPARIHVLLARDAPVGVVIRRGPSKQVATMLWNLETDTFEMGQWLKGRIYERRSDLSPDGRHMIYFAMNGKWQSDSKGSWTAISRAPYLKALVFLPKGDCWHGGGLWTGDVTYWLNDGYGHVLNVVAAKLRGLFGRVADRLSSDLRQDKGFIQHFPSGECLGVYYDRLVRDGWSYEGVISDTRVKRGWMTDSSREELFVKLVSPEWRLEKIAHSQLGAPPGKGCYWDEHRLVNRARGVILSFPDWEWAEVIGGVLAWAELGKLFRGSLNGEGLAGVREIADLNPMKFEPIVAPY